ncbi:MAG: aminotransferase class IV [Longimicrobiales bacterium]|nr:aminotransferase class IV [Longimicrobiales bacterium]
MIWVNGSLLPDTTPVFGASDRGALLGDGLFETLAVRGGVARHLDRHLARLTAGARFFGIPLPVPVGDLHEGVEALLAAEGLAGGRAASRAAGGLVGNEAGGAVGGAVGGAEAGAVLRITLSRGPGPRGLAPPETAHPLLLMTATPHRFETPRPRRLAISEVVRHPGAVTSRWKTLNYLDSVVALEEARRRGCDDALLPNGIGGFACATHANLFIVTADDGPVATPRVEDGALPGITRGRVIETLRAIGREVREVAVDGSGIARADEVFLTNSVAGVVPVEAVGDRVLPASRPLTEALMEAMTR